MACKAKQCFIDNYMNELRAGRVVVGGIPVTRVSMEAAVPLVSSL